MSSVLDDIFFSDDEQEDNDVDLSDSDDENNILAEAGKTVQSANRRMSLDEQSVFAMGVASGQTLHKESQSQELKRNRKRRDSIQYYQDVQAQLQTGMQALSLQRQASLKTLLKTQETQQQQSKRITTAAAAKNDKIVILSSTAQAKTQSAEQSAEQSAAAQSATVAVEVEAVADGASVPKKTKWQSSPTLILQPMRFGTKPLSNQRPIPIVSDPSPIPKHLTALKRTTKQSLPQLRQRRRRRPQSARVPKQRYSRTPKQLVRVPPRLRPYLTAISTKEAMKQQTRKRKKRKRNKSTREEKRSTDWTSSKQHTSLKKFVSLSRNQWNIIVASGLKSTSSSPQHQHQHQLYGKSLLASDSLQLQLAQSLNSLENYNNNNNSNNNNNNSASIKTTISDATVNSAWRELQSRIEERITNQKFDSSRSLRLRVIGSGMRYCSTPAVKSPAGYIVKLENV